jgi:hypothetical protein
MALNPPRMEPPFSSAFLQQTHAATLCSFVIASDYAHPILLQLLKDSPAVGSFATISGSVLDPDAKAVPIATVVVKNELSGVERMGLSPSTFDFVLSDFSCQCVPVNVEYLRCLALVAAAPGKRGLNELLLKFLQGFVETNFLLQHFSHESIQYFFHTTPLRSAQPQRFCSNGSGIKSGAASRTDGALGDGGRLKA